MPTKNALKVEDICWAVLVGLAAGAFLALASLGGCAGVQPTLGNLASNPTTVTTLKIAACVQGAMAEEEQQRLRDRREAERQAAEEAEAINDAAREHPGSTKEAIEKVLKDGAKQ